LRDWWRAARPQVWLFPGQNPINPMTPRQLNRAVHAAKDLAGISKRQAWFLPPRARAVAPLPPPLVHEALKKFDQLMFEDDRFWEHLKNVAKEAEAAAANAARIAAEEPPGSGRVPLPK
jgi:hypothetical protein